MAFMMLSFWVLGVVSGATLGYWVHLFLIIALLSAFVGLAGLARTRKRWA